MGQTPLLATRARSLIPVTGSGVGSDPSTTGIPGDPSDVDAALAALQAEVDAIEAEIAAIVTGITVDDGTVTVSPVDTLSVPLTVDLGGGSASLPYLTNIGGERPITVTESTVTGTYNFDLSQGNLFDLTLTGNVTSSTVSNPPPASGTFYIVLRQGGAGSFTFVFPASFVWQAADGTDGGSAPTLFTAVDARNIIGAATADGGTSWGAWDEAGGGGGTPATTVTDETTWGITPAVGSDTEYARQDHTHGSPAAPFRPILITDTPAGSPLVFADLLQNDAGTDLLYADL